MFDTTTTTTTTTATLCGRYQPGVSATSGPTVSVECSYPSTYSRYVIVQFETTGHAALCEVEAYSTQGLCANIYTFIRQMTAMAAVV